MALRTIRGCLLPPRQELKTVEGSASPYFHTQHLALPTKLEAFPPSEWGLFWDRNCASLIGLEASSSLGLYLPSLEARSLKSLSLPSQWGYPRPRIISNFDSKSLPLPTTFLTTLTSWEWETEDASLHLTHNSWLGSGWPFPGSQDQEGLFAVLCGKASLPWHSLATTS